MRSIVMEGKIMGAEANGQQVRSIVAPQAIALNRSDRELHQDLIHVRGGLQRLVRWQARRRQPSSQRVREGAPQPKCVDCKLPDILAQVIARRSQRSPSLPKISRSKFAVVEPLHPRGQLLD